MPKRKHVRGGMLADPPHTPRVQPRDKQALGEIAAAEV